MATDTSAVPSKAGRNLPAAIGSGVALAVAVLASLLLVKQAFVVLVAIVLAVAIWELRRAMAGSGRSIPFVTIPAGISVFLGAYRGGAEWLVVGVVAAYAFVLWWRAADGYGPSAVRDTSAGAFVLLYPSLLAGFVALLLRPDDGALRVIFFILVTVFSDIGGYAVGVLIGKHPMAPSVSPKKSWEGFAGSVLICASIGAIALPLMLDGRWWWGALIGAASAAVATTGDLVESLIKRDLGIKDMGDLLPGHGGIMDRVDSLVFTAPLLWAALTVAVPT